MQLGRHQRDERRGARQRAVAAANEACSLEQHRLVPGDQRAADHLHARRRTTAGSASSHGPVAPSRRADAAHRGEHRGARTAPPAWARPSSRTSPRPAARARPARPARPPARPRPGASCRRPGAGSPCDASSHRPAGCRRAVAGPDRGGPGRRSRCLLESPGGNPRRLARRRPSPHPARGRLAGPRRHRRRGVRRRRGVVEGAARAGGQPRPAGRRSTTPTTTPTASAAPTTTGSGRCGWSARAPRRRAR